MLIIRMMVLIASFAMVSGGGAEAAAKAQTADICAGSTAGSTAKGGIKLAASGALSSPCCPPRTCRNVKICGEEVEGCCYKKTKSGLVCSCGKICASCR